jgi:hypothetical protein
MQLTIGIIVIYVSLFLFPANNDIPNTIFWGNFTFLKEFSTEKSEFGNKNSTNIDSKAVVINLFFVSRYPARLKKNWRHPYLAKMTVPGTHSSKKTKKGSKFNIWRHP